MTVSLVPGSRGVGSVCVPMGYNWPGPGAGATGAWPLFQFDRVVHWPLVFVAHSAGIRLSLMYSGPPWATSTSQLLPPLLMALTRPVLAYCQNFHGCVGFGGSSHGP